MKVVLLCAGFGTRPYPLTRDTAKPRLPVAGRPVVEHLLAQLDAAGRFDEFIVVSNRHFADRSTDGDCSLSHHSELQSRSSTIGPGQ